MFDREPPSAVPLVSIEVDLNADIPVEAAAAAAVIVLLVVLTTVALPLALTVRSSVADASRFKNTVAEARPPRALIPKSTCMMID